MNRPQASVSKWGLVWSYWYEHEFLVSCKLNSFSQERSCIYSFVLKVRIFGTRKWPILYNQLALMQDASNILLIGWNMLCVSTCINNTNNIIEQGWVDVKNYATQEECYPPRPKAGVITASEKWGDWWDTGLEKRLLGQLFAILLHPLWNHWRSVQSDWLSAVWFTPKSYHFLL